MLNIIFFAVFGALGLSGIILWAKAIQRFKNRTCLVDPLGKRDLVGSPFGLLDVFLVFFAWFGGQVIAVGLALFFLGVPMGEMDGLTGERQAQLLGIVGGGQLVATMAALGLLWLRYRLQWSAISIQPKHFSSDVLIGLASFAMVIPLILIVQWILTLLVPYEHASLEMLTKDASLATFIFVWFVAGVVAPITEEVFFRGVLQAWLQRLSFSRMNSDQILVGGWDGLANDGKPASIESCEPAEETEKPICSDNPYQSPVGAPSLKDVGQSLSGNRSWITNSYWPIIATAAFFACMHLGQGAAPIPLFLFAVVLGFLFRKTGSILPCIVLHMLLNLFSLFWYTVGLFFGEAAEPNVVTPEVAWLFEFLI